VLLSARLLGIEGRLQREGLVIHVIAKHLIDLSPYLATLNAPLDATSGVPPNADAAARSLYRARNFR
jgi:error-prone DNA polymerase